MSEQTNKRKYHSLEEVLNAADKKNWNDLHMDEIEDTEENRQIVEDGIFWCGVECMRLTYTRDSILELMRWLVCLRKLWNQREDGETNEHTD